MDSLLLQDWTTIRGSSTVTILTQSETDWLDLRLYQDVVAWLEVKEFSPPPTHNPTLVYQTSPTKDDALFFTMAYVPITTTGVMTTVMLKDAMPPGSPPCARWFRWQIQIGGFPWDLTFRVYVAANRVGRRVAISDPVALGALEDAGSQYAYGQCGCSGVVPPTPIYAPQPPPIVGGPVGQGQVVQTQWPPPGQGQHGPLPRVQGDMSSLGEPTTPKVQGPES